MSQHEPTEAYVYQPERPGDNNGFIFAVSGPHSEAFRHHRFATREDAQAVADSLNARKVTSAMLIAIGKSPEVAASVRRDPSR